jgi:hypothetical protein
MVFVPDEPGGGGNSPPLPVDIGRGLACLLIPSLPSFFFQKKKTKKLKNLSIYNNSNIEKNFINIYIHE